MASNDDEDSTQLSLLQALVNDANREESWRRFLRRYEPLIYRWCRRWHLQHASIEDVSAAVVAKLYVGLRTYEPEQGRFRPWLKTVVEHAVQDHLRHARRHPGDEGAGDSAVLEKLHQVTAPDAVTDLTDSLDQEISGDLQRAMEVVRAKVEPRTWEAFWRRAYEGQPARDVAQALGLSTGAVYQAAFRTGQQIRKEYLKLLGGAPTNDEGQP